MTRDEYIHELELLLKDIPELERRDIILDFEEHFFNAMQNGKNEQEIIANLGSPKVIAKEVKANYFVNQAKTDSSVRSLGRAIISTVSLGFFNLVIVLGPVLALIAVVFTFYVTSLALIIAAFCIIALYFGDIIAVQLQEVLFPAMAVGGLGVMLGIATIHLTKWLYGILVRYLQFNLRVIKGDRG